MNIGALVVLTAVSVASAMSNGPVRKPGSPAELSSQAPAADDYVPPPPERAEFFSRAKNYLLVLSTPDRWKTRRAIAELFQIDGAGRRQALWTRHLDHEWRPRYALVSDSGEVLFIDEWANIKSRFAVMIVDREDRLVARHDFDAVREVLGLPVAQVVKAAKHGWWVGGPPRLGPSGREAAIEAAGKLLQIDLPTGRLSIATK